MGSSPLAGPYSTKMEALHNAVNVFVGRWGNIRSLEGADAPTDNIGVVLFDSGDQWLGGVTGIGDFDVRRPGIEVDILGVSAGGSTSMGDGTFTAEDALFAGGAAGNRKVILLMSDGWENAPRRIRVWDTVAGAVLNYTDLGARTPDQLRIQISNSTTTQPVTDADWDDLDNEDLLAIYTVTVGSGWAVDAELNESIAYAGNGFYVNSETDPEILATFFVEMLQNFLQFNSPQAARLVTGEVRLTQSGPVGFPISFPLTSTTEYVALDVSWNEDIGNICADVLPPTRTAPIEVCGDNGRLQWSTSLPLGAPFSTDGDWQIVFEPDGDLVSTDRLQFHVNVTAEDRSGHAYFEIVAGDHIAGDLVPLRIEVTENGKPVTGLTNVTALVAAPDESIGDLLAASGTPPDQPYTDDSLNSGNAALQNYIDDPDNQDTFDKIQMDPIEFFDDGLHNDGDANDGVYGGVMQTAIPGHYHVLFDVQGETRRSGDIRRQQLVSTLVRAQPSSDPDDLDLEVEAGPDSTAAGAVYKANLNLVTPAGYQIGPWHASHLWFVPAVGQPIKATDNGDGTYSATFGESNGAVAIHYLTIAQVLDDDITAAELPANVFTSGTQLVADAREFIVDDEGRWSISGAIGLNDPNGNFANVVDGSFGYDLGVQYAYSPQWAVELAYGQDMFDGKSSLPDIDIGHLRLNGKAFFPIGANRGWASVGYGSYNFDPGPTEQGFNLGVGYQFDAWPQWDGEIKLNYHDVDASGASINFYTLQFGLRYNF
jgi:opacity protein-like surface antigen